MSALKSVTMLAAGAVLGAGVLIAHRIAEETGKPLQEALADVPAELERLYVELKNKGAEALEKGRAAYEQRLQGATEDDGEFGAAEE